MNDKNVVRNPKQFIAKLPQIFRALMEQQIRKRLGNNKPKDGGEQLPEGARSIESLEDLQWAAGKIQDNIDDFDGTRYEYNINEGDVTVQGDKIHIVTRNNRDLRRAIRYARERGLQPQRTNNGITVNPKVYIPGPKGPNTGFFGPDHQRGKLNGKERPGRAYRNDMYAVDGRTGQMRSNYQGPLQG